jgi:activator of HSP90 ATPase
MRSIIRQSVLLPAAAEALYRMYLEPAAHAAFTGAPVVIGDQPGAIFEAFGGVLTGTILEVVQPRLIVQSWRSSIFNAEDPDSTLILLFTPQQDAGRIDLIHLDVPDHDYAGVTQGWEKYYWTPWRAYLESPKQ